MTARVFQDEANGNRNAVLAAPNWKLCLAEVQQKSLN